MPTSRTRPSAKSSTCSAPGIADQALDVFGDQLLGADPHIHGDAALGEQPVRVVYSGARMRAILVGVRYSA